MGVSVTTMQETIRRAVRSITIDSNYSSKDELKEYIENNFNDTVKSYLSNESVNNYFNTQIDNIWNKQCIRIIKAKIKEYKYDYEMFRSISREDFKNNVIQNLSENYRDHMDNNEISKEINNIWEYINEKKKRIENNIFNIINSINKDSINSEKELDNQIKNNLRGDDTQIFNAISDNIGYDTKLLNAWHGILEDRRKNLLKKIQEIELKYNIYNYCKNKEDLINDIENNYLNGNEMKFIRENEELKTNLDNKISTVWRKLEISREEGKKKL